MTSRVATVSIDVAAVNDAPAVELAPAGPVDEAAAPVALTAQATDVDGDAVTYAWSTTTGRVAGFGETAEFSADDGPATAQVTVTADDGNGGVGTATIAVEVRNVAPTADAGADAESPWGLPVSLAGSATDASPEDAARGLGASWDLGDGSPAAGGFAVSHAYAEPGTYTATLTAADKDGGSGSDTATVVVGARRATVSYSGAAGLLGSAAAVAAQLADADDATSARLAGHAVTFALGAQTCTAATDVTGAARCTIDAFPLPLGPATVEVSLGADGLYEAATASAEVVLYGLPAGGMFVVGDDSAEGVVTFSSPQWWRENRLSGGTAPASFKGFAAAATPTCGVAWTAEPGFGGTPSAVPEWMGVVVASRVTKTGPLIGGDAVRIVVVRTGGYQAPPVGRGTGTVVAPGC
jgi:PKD repeat protein